jgi:hypothetical protein
VLLFALAECALGDAVLVAAFLGGFVSWGKRKRKIYDESCYERGLGEGGLRWMI